MRIVVYDDFGCGFCRTFARDVLPDLEDEYVSTGPVSIEYRHLAFLGQYSNEAAAASECAAEQDLFWQYHDLLVGETQRTYKEHARTLQATREGSDLNLTTFDTCIDNRTHVAAVQAQTTALGMLGRAAERWLHELQAPSVRPPEGRRRVNVVFARRRHGVQCLSTRPTTNSARCHDGLGVTQVEASMLDALYAAVHDSSAWSCSRRAGPKTRMTPT